MTVLGQPWPNWSFSSNHSAQIYVWIYENRAKDLSPSLTLYKKLHRPFNSIIHRQSVNTQPTHPPFLCLAGWCLDSQLAGQCLARALLQRKSAFSLTKMPVSVTHPTPPGERAAPPCLVSTGSQTTKLSPPTLLDGSPPGFSSTGEASLPAIAGRQAKKFCFKLDTVFKNSDISIYIYSLFLRLYFMAVFYS